MKQNDSIPYLWRRLPLLAPLLGVVFALMLVPPAWAAPATVTNQDIPINTTLSNPCNGESVALSGVAHETSNVISNGSGGLLVMAHLNGNLTGTGSFGNKYVGNLEETFTRNVPSSGSEFTHTFTTILTSQGSAPNFTTAVLEHFTVNPDGTTTVSFTNFTSRCGG
jgi:hypothetical protein